MENLWSVVSEAFVIMIIGMTNVFLMLTIAMLGMMLIGYFASPERRKKRAGTSVESSKEEIVSVNEPTSSEDEEIALAAAVAVAHHNMQKAKNIGLIIRKDVEV